MQQIKIVDIGKEIKVVKRIEEDKEYLLNGLIELRNFFELVKHNIQKCKDAKSPVQEMFYRHAWEYMPDMEVEFVVQRNKGRWYQIDFALPDINLAIEIDGKKYHPNVFDKERSTDKTNKDYERQLHLQRMGWSVIRFTGSQIYNKARWCVQYTLERAISMGYIRKKNPVDVWMRHLKDFELFIKGENNT